MDYAILFSVMGVAIMFLTWERFRLLRENNRAKQIAALLIAEKMGMKINGEKVKIELEEVEEQ